MRDENQVKGGANELEREKERIPGLDPSFSLIVSYALRCAHCRNRAL